MELEAVSLTVRTDVDDELLKLLIVHINVELCHILTKLALSDLADVRQVDPVEQISQLAHSHL